MIPWVLTLAACFLGAVSRPAIASEDLLVADFEGTDYGAWTTTGEAFGPGPARGTLPGQMAVDGFKGGGLVNSFHRGDGTTGTLTSPPFTIQRRYLSFLIGGGRDLERTCLQLLVEGRRVRTATGPNDRPGGSETLAPEFWDVAEFAGKTARIRIVDEATGGWGHINVDHIVQTDRRPPGLLTNASREFRVEKRYLNIPIKNGAPRREVTLRVDGREVVRNDMELANGEADWWAFMDVGAWRGRTLVLEVDKLPEDSAALASMEAGDTIRGAEDLYREPLRGQFHFSSRRGWNNDPNGLVYFKGEYHLFYQHNPYGWGWGNMHWGHAVSTDLVHWRELGDKLMPDPLGPMFSGSAVVDWKNTSGLGSEGRPPMVLVYTAAGSPTVQCLASSTDGRVFTKHAGNPVLKEITGGNRDPKVFWHEPTRRWVMVLYVTLPKDRHTVHFFTSPNLKDWSLASITEGIAGSSYLYECPDFFELPVDGDPAQWKWVLTAANSEYAVGTFDGTTFRPEQSRLPGHRGRGFYAAQTFSDIPATDGRRIQIGWFQTETRGMPFNQSMTIPLELRLVTTAEGPRMTFTPVRELERLRARTHAFSGQALGPGAADPLSGVQAELVELRAEFEPGDAVEVVFRVRGAEVVYDVAGQALVVNGHRAPAPLSQGRQRLVVFCDRTGLEVFASDGLTYVPMPFQPAAGDRALSVTVRGGTARLVGMQVHELRSAWEGAGGAAQADPGPGEDTEVAVAEAPVTPVTITVLSAGQAQPVPARLHLRDAAGKPVQPPGFPAWHEHFVCTGAVTLGLAPGRYEIVAERGPEHGTAATAFTVGPAGTSVTLSLARLADLALEGWWSGETHVHRAPHEVEMLMRAEDLHVAHVITWWNRANPWAGAVLPRDLPVRFDGDRYLHLLGGEDERDGGALLYLDRREPLAITAGGRHFPSSVQYAREARAEGAAWIDAEKPFWWDFPMWVALGLVDSVGLAHNHMQRDGMLDNEAWGRARDLGRYPGPRGNGAYTQDLYHHLLNAGVRLPPSAGSASGVLPNPVGYNRVYVHADGAFTYDAWRQGLKAGRSFVSNGPLLRCRANGELPGHVFRSAGPLEIRLEGRLDSRDPVSSVQRVQDGRVETVSLPHTFVVRESGWFLVCATAGVTNTHRFASTAPWYVEVDGRPMKPKEPSVRLFQDWVRVRMEHLGALEAVTPEQRESLLEPWRMAATFWSKKLAEATVGDPR